MLMRIQNKLTSILEGKDIDYRGKAPLISFDF